jgi:hypothetical protein
MVSRPWASGAASARYSIKGPVYEYEATVLYKEFDTELSPPAMFLRPPFSALLQAQAEANPDEARRLAAPTASGRPSTTAATPAGCSGCPTAS